MHENHRPTYKFKQFVGMMYLTAILIAPVNFSGGLNAYTRQQEENFCMSYAFAQYAGKIEEATAIALHDEGRNFSHQGNYQRALEKYRESLIIYYALGNKSWEAILVSDIGIVSYFLGKYDEARECFSVGLALIEGSNDLGDISNQSAFWGNTGLALIAQGDYKNALIALNKAISISRELQKNWNIDGRSGEAVMLGNIATIYERIGQPEKAMEFNRQARDAATVGISYDGEANKYMLIAHFSGKLGDNLEAIDLYKKALALYSIDMNKGMEATVLVSIGEQYELMKEYELALDNYESALEIFIDTENLMNQADTLARMGDLYVGKQEYHTALNAYQRSYNIAEQVNYIAQMGKAANNIGNVYQSLERYEEARIFYQKALDIFRLEGRLDDEWQTLADIGSMYAAVNKNDESIAYYVDAVEKLETLHSDLSVGELRTSLSNRTFLPYANLIELLWKSGQHKTAFEYSEKARARVFLNELAFGKIDLSSNTDARLLENESKLKEEILALRRQLVLLQNRPSPEWDLETISTVKDEIQTLETEYTNLIVEIKLQSPELSSLVTVDTSGLDETQNLISEDTTLVEYFVADDQTYVFIVTKNSFNTVAIDVKSEELEKNISSFRLFANTSISESQELKYLSNQLVLPIMDYIKTSKVALVPHGPLHYLPFSALQNKGIYFGERFVLFYLPSATSLRYLDNQQVMSSASALVIGNPFLEDQSFSNLYYAEQEADSVAKLNNTQSLTGSQATESLFKLQSAEKGILHIAAHADYNPYNPLFSTIYLAGDEINDGRLEVHEIYNLDLAQHTTLVILSACETNIGTKYAGDDVISITRAFMFAGTQTVISSLWTVEDEATEALMVAFYHYWIDEGMTKSEALQAAQAEVRASAKWSSPYYWAGFILNGDPYGYYRSDLHAPITSPAPLNAPCVSTILFMVMIYLVGGKSRLSQI